VLPQQVFSVVVPVRGADHGVDVLAVRRARVLGEVPQVRGGLVVELDQDDRAVDPVVEDAVVGRPADPGEVGLPDV
jgi:hypothetical protein